MIVFLNLWVTSQLASSGKTDGEPIGMGEPPKVGDEFSWLQDQKEREPIFSQKLMGGVTQEDIFLYIILIIFYQKHFL